MTSPPKKHPFHWKLNHTRIEDVKIFRNIGEKLILVFGIGASEGRGI